jgi:hypothetical protein
MPGWLPPDFCRQMVQCDGSGGAPTFGPRTTSSTVSGRLTIRFVNQLESGTSSMVLMFCARMPAGFCRGNANRL